MATISQRITLEGADDIRKKLEELGVAGEKAFKQIQDAAKKPIVDPAQIDKSKQAFDQLAAAATQTGNAIAQAGQQAETAGRSIGAGLETAARNFTVAATAIAFAISAVVRSLTSGAGETAQELTKQANVLNISIEQWLKLKTAIDQAGGSSEEFIRSTAPLIRNLQALSLAVSGVNVKTFADGTSVVIHSMQQMTPETKAMVAELRKFGITLQDIRQGDPVALMTEIAKSIDKMPAGMAQAAAGIKFFGIGWQDTIKTLLAGTSAMNDTVGAMGQMRIASRQLSAEQVKDSKDAADQWGDLGKAIRAIKDQIGAMFAGTSFARAEWLTHMVDDARILLTTFLKLDAAGRASFLAGLGDSAAETTFKVLVALGEQLAGIWNTLLVPAGAKLMGIFDGIAGIFEGITGSQVAAFFITAAIAAAGLAVALKGIALVLTPLTALMSLVFGPLGPLLLAAGVAAFLFWDKLKAGAQTVAALIPQELAAIGESIQKLFAGDFSGFWDQFASAAVSAFGKIAAAAEADQGVVGQVFRGLKIIIADLPGALELVVKSFVAIGIAAQGVADIINFIFRTKLTGTDIAVVIFVEAFIGVLGVLAATLIVVSNGIGIFVTICTALGTAVAALLAPFVAVSASVAALVIGIALLVAAIITLNWDSIKQAAVDAWNAVVGAIQGAITAVVNFVSSMLTITWDVISSAGVAAWNAVTGAINAAIAAISQFIGLAQKGGGGTATVTAPASKGFARGGLLGGRGSGTSDSNLAWLSRGEYVMPARVASQPGMLAFLEALRRSGNIPGYAAGGGIGAGGLQILEDFPLIAQMLKNLMDFIAEMGDAEESVRKLTEFGRKWHLNFASGGVVGGRGTGTSDSNLAWVSRGEHVMPAAVVRQPGVLALLEALRRGGDLRRLLDGMGRFALGGPVGMPALAGGGTGSMSHVTIQFPNGPTIGGLRASSAVVEELQRAAAMAQVRSGGRKPSRYT